MGACHEKRPPRVKKAPPANTGPAWQGEVRRWPRAKQQEYGRRWHELVEEGFLPEAAQYLAWDEMMEEEK